MIKRKAIILLSGGLDSTIVVHLMREQNVALVCLHFTSPFCTCNSGCKDKNFAMATASKLNLPYLVKFMGKKYLDIVASPRYGYGKNMNPCIDCRIHKFKLAKKVMNEEHADFIITGEVLGQRPMSQNLRAMQLIEKESKLEGLVLRPLSANVLEPTIPEKKGWIDRKDLLAITGRSRKKQLELTKILNIEYNDYSCPAGGCRLTMKSYSMKLKDLLKYNVKLTFKDVYLLNKGRHFRISEDFKIIVGRNQTENELLDKFANNGEIKMWARDHNSPLCIGIGQADTDKLRIMAGICGRYTDCKNNENINIVYRFREKDNYLEAGPFDPEEILKYKIC